MATTAAAQILVVEDERDIAALVAFHLTKEGFRVRTVGSGRDALEAAFAEQIGDFEEMQIATVGASVGAEIRNRAILAVFDRSLTVERLARVSEYFAAGWGVEVSDAMRAAGVPTSLVYRTGRVY